MGDVVDSETNALRCRALLLDVIRRAAHDWILYRYDRRNRELAEDARIWLFEEKPGHRWWTARDTPESKLMAFLNICAAVDLDPAYVRATVSKMTPRQIKTAGRHPERRSRIASDDPNYLEHGVTDNVSLTSLDDSDSSRYSSSYEAHYAVHTSD